MNDSGFHATGYLNAKDAYDEMYNNLYDLIISDIMMPEINGFEFASTVRNINKTIPILFMSAKDDLPSKKKGFLIGIDDYMIKPIEFSFVHIFGDTSLSWMDIAVFYISKDTVSADCEPAAVYRRKI